MGFNDEINNNNDMNKIGKAAGGLARKAAHSKKGKQLIRMALKKAAPYIAAFIAIIIIVSVIFTAVEGFLQQKIVSDKLSPDWVPTPEDREILRYEMEATDRTNQEYRYNLTQFERPYKRTAILNYKKYEEEFEPYKDSNLKDYFMLDEDLGITWAYLQTYLKYLETGSGKDMDKLYPTATSMKEAIDEACKELHPTFYYSDSEIRTDITKTVISYQLEPNNNLDIIDTLDPECPYYDGQFVYVKDTKTLYKVRVNDAGAHYVQGINNLIRTDNIANLTNLKQYKGKTIFNYASVALFDVVAKETTTNTTNKEDINLLDFARNLKNVYSFDYTKQVIVEERRNGLLHMSGGRPARVVMEYNSEGDKVKQEEYYYILGKEVSQAESSSFNDDSIEDDSEEIVKEHIVTTKPLLDNMQELVEAYEPLKEVLCKKYEKREDKEGLQMAVDFITNIAENYAAGTSDMSWTFANMSNFDGIVTSNIVPAQLMDLFKMAEKKYGIPWWFLAGVAYKESTFNIKAENPKSHCYGLMQLTPENWQRIATELGYDPVKDKDNPEAQIMCGAKLLKDYLGDLNWKVEDWKEPTLPGLTLYSGWGNDKEGCRVNYAEDVWKYAEGFKDQDSMTGSKKWPTPGYTKITSPYGPRIHPITKKSSFHTGIDIAAPLNAHAIASIDGEVTFVGFKGAYGLMVEITNGNTKLHYCHLKSVEVSMGDTVKQGQYIANIDSTGASTGNHLHFEVLINGNTIDPTTWFSKE